MSIKVNSYISCFIKTSFICFCGIGFNKILGFLDTKCAGIKYKGGHIGQKEVNETA